MMVRSAKRRPGAESGFRQRAFFSGDLPCADLEMIRTACRRRARLWAAVSCAGGLLPLPGLDAAVDSLLMQHWLHAFARDFGLVPGEARRTVPVGESRRWNRPLRVAIPLFSALLSRRLLMAGFGREGMRRALRYLPLAGQAAASTFACAATLRVAYAHIDACHAAARARRQDRPHERRPAR